MGKAYEIKVDTKSTHPNSWQKKLFQKEDFIKLVVNIFKHQV